jgi:hypothetical protein
MLKLMTTFLKTILAASSVAALAVWIRHAQRPRVDADDDFPEFGAVDGDGLEIDDDTAAEIIRRARPELERARELVRQV